MKKAILSDALVRVTSYSPGSRSLPLNATAAGARPDRAVKSANDLFGVTFQSALSESKMSGLGESQ